MKTIIFDFDGTIANSYENLFEIVEKLAPEFGVKLSESEIEKYRDESLADIVKNLKISKIKLLRIVFRIRQELTERMPRLNTIEGINVVLEKLKNKNYNLAIVSSSSKKIINKFLSNNNLEIFDFILTENSLFGKDKLLNDLISKNNLEKDECIYVGDEIRDIDAANKAGIKIISVSWGFNTRKVLKKNNRTVIDKPEELLNIL